MHVGYISVEKTRLSYGSLEPFQYNNAIQMTFRSSDIYLQRGYLASIRIQWKHNHYVASADCLQRREVSEHVKEKLIMLYKEGATQSGAHYELQRQLETALSPMDYLLVSADRRVMPDKQYCHR